MSFPRYPKYKDSGVAWARQIPDHWGVTRLKNVFELMKRVPEEGDDIVTAFRDGEVTLRTNRRVDGFTHAAHEHGYQRVLPDDLVIHAMDAFAGAIGVSDSAGKSTPVYSVCRARSQQTSVHYFGRLLRHMALSDFVQSLAKGIRERSTEFRWKEASQVLLPEPPPAEQISIAAFLDRETTKIDALIAEQQRLIELLQEKRQAVISHAVTKGLNPDAPMKDSGIEWLGQVPEHWDLGALKQFWGTTDCKHITADFVDEGFPLASIREVQSRWIDLSNAKQTTDHFYRQLIEGGRQPLEGDLIFSRNATVGEVAQVPSDPPAFAMGQDVCLLRRHRTEFSADYLHAVLRSRVVVEQIEQLMIGSTFKRINVEQIRGLLVPMPPSDEQDAIATAISAAANDADRLVTNANTAITLLQERRSALISAAVTGQIDVRGFSTGGSEAA